MATKKKTSPLKTLLVSLLALIIGALVGYVFAKFYSINSVEFYLLGEAEENVGIGSTYNEAGFVCNIKGEDCQDKVVVTYYDESFLVYQDIVTTEAKTYFVEYKLNVGKINSKITRKVNVVEIEDLEINFMMLGNQYAGDSIYIKAGNVDILVDAGSREDSALTLTEYMLDDESGYHSYVSDNKLEYVIATHADQDHIAAFVGDNGIFNTFEIETLIEFPKTNKSTLVYKAYRSAVQQLEANGTKVYSALECYNEVGDATRVIELAAGIKLEILYNYYYENHTKNENNYSVCFMLYHGTEKFLFTGDLENEGNAEEYLVNNNNLGEVYLYKLGHHGSKTSSSTVLLSEIKPKVAVATCVAFTTEYTTNTDNTFPTKAAIDNLVNVGTVQHLYVPSMVSNNSLGYEPANGNLVVYANENGLDVYCSNSNEDFYNFDIFKQYRKWTVS